MLTLNTGVSQLRRLEEEAGEDCGPWEHLCVNKGFVLPAQLDFFLRKNK